MLLDSTLVFSRPPCRYIEIPATGDARTTLGREIVANIIMLGALVEVTGIVSRNAIEKAILDSVPKGTESLNMKAMQRGFELARKEST
jgi:2-oxoglutarate ferredoxin oxidoreductase subunit gamma